jgi:hypothetical protein
MEDGVDGLTDANWVAIEEWNKYEDGWTNELETQLLEEQPPYPFATDVELDELKRNGIRT